METREGGVNRKDEGMETRERVMVKRDEGRTGRRAMVGAAGRPGTIAGTGERGAMRGDARRTGRRAMVGAAVAAVVMVAAMPEALHACPVCFDRDDEARIAFLATTGLLTLLPLGLVAGTGAWLRRRMREMRGEEGGGGER